MTRCTMEARISILPINPSRAQSTKSLISPHYFRASQNIIHNIYRSLSLPRHNNVKGKSYILQYKYITRVEYTCVAVSEE